jgi:hypothetical protein
MKLVATARRSRWHADIGPVDEHCIPVVDWELSVDDLGKMCVHHEADFQWKRQARQQLGAHGARRDLRGSVVSCRWIRNLNLVDLWGIAIADVSGG